MIYIVGLGNTASDLTLGGAQIINTCKQVVVKTNKTSTYGYFSKNSIKNTTLDNIYEISADFDELNSKLANTILQFATEGDVCYCVNGNAYDDRSVKLLQQICAQKAIEIKLIAGVSAESELLFNSQEVSYNVCSCYDVLDNFNFNKNFPLVIKDIDNKFLASELKLVLDNIYGEESEIVIYNGKNFTKMKVYEIDRLDTYNYQTSLLTIPQKLIDYKRFNFNDLMQIMSILRGENGCKWDRAQTHLSIRSNLIEEAYELVNAINNEDTENMLEETGDVLLQAVFHSVIAKDCGEYNVEDVLTALCQKLLTRHTHIFGDVVASSEAEALQAWENAKAKEKNHTNYSDRLKSIASELPSLMQALKIQKTAKKVGFDWSKIDGAYNKVLEELDELKNEENDKELEAGDLLFSVVNVLRFLDINPEIALMRTCNKFINRFDFMEKRANERNKQLTDLSLDCLEKLWQESKLNF
ncbi:MAG: nucleoside triphosphate pyrophosphohydrolase [Clostridia bacterium]